MKKAGAINNEMFVRMLNPPNRDNILHSQRLEQRHKAKMMREHPELLQQAGKKK